MGKKSILYKIRRKGQVMANRVMNPVALSKIYFKAVLKYAPNFSEPGTFNEKLQWLKLNYWPNHEKAIRCADKYRVRDYIEEVGEGALLNELYGAWDSAEEIDWEKLPEKFVLKCNHGCGYNILCRDKKALDIAETKKKLDRWMKEDFGEFNVEPHYSKIPRKIICEKYLGDDVINYNIYCFNGKAAFFSLAGGLGDGEGEHLTYYRPNGEKAPFKNRAYPTGNMPLSPKLSEMLTIAERLAKPFPMVRVDLFDIDGKIILSEMTFTPGGALIPIEPIEADKKLGDMLDLSEVMKK